MGIPANRQKAIFDSFTQADNSTTRRFGGSGLGLTICRQLAELMGGTISVQSELGVGTTFTVVVMLDVQEKDAPSSVEALSSDPSISPMMVLLVEDNPINQQVCLQRLERMGHEVLVVDDGKKAVEAFTQARFDLILMDVQMPVMGGLEATLQIRSAEAGSGRRTPIIAMTARAMEGDRQRCLDAGMDAYVTKPFTSAILAKALAEATETAFVAESQEQSEETCFDANAFKKWFSQLNEEETSDLKMAGQLFLQTYEDNLALLCKSIDGKVLNEVQFRAHSLKGEMGVFNLKYLQSLAFFVEKAATENDLDSVERVFPELEAGVKSMVDELKILCQN